MNNTAPTFEDWAIADVLSRKQFQFVLWMIANGKCRNTAEFHRNFRIDEKEFPLERILQELRNAGFISEKNGVFSVQMLGEKALSWVGDRKTIDDPKKKTEVVSSKATPNDCGHPYRRVRPEKPEEFPPQRSPFTWGTGRRKTAVARVRIREGTGLYVVNELESNDYFPLEGQRKDIREPLVLTEMAGRVDVLVNVNGGGKQGQAGAVRLGLARALKDFRVDLEPKLRESGFLTRDPRMVERKKFGHKKARKSFQFSKR